MLAPDESTPAREDAIMIDGESDLSLEKETSIEARLTRRGSFCSGVNLVGNRLFGPQPQTATYLCLWEADLGRVTGHTSPAMLSTLQKVGKTFALNFSDKGNSPPPNIELAVDPDSELLLLTTAPFRARKLNATSLLSLCQSPFSRSRSEPLTSPFGLPLQRSTSFYPQASSSKPTISPRNPTEV